MPVVENIRRYATKKHKSISQIESEAGLSNGAISKWDKSSPIVSNLKEVARVLGCSIEDLIKE